MSAKIPIALLAFDRPQYFEQVVRSLLAQRNFDPARCDVFLFQDGAFSPVSRSRYASDAAIHGVREIFTRHFPSENMFCSEVNLGIAGNYRRAEQFVFDRLGAELAFFLEDDLVLGEAFMANATALGAALAGRRDVSHFSVYGDQVNAYRDSQEVFTALDHQWAFGLFRHAWQRIDAELGWYYAILAGDEYRYRDNRAVFEGLRRLGFAGEGTSQDIVKASVCASLGLARINTRASYGTYIGQHGAHMSAAEFERLGYGRTRVAAEDLVLDPAEIDAAIGRIRAFQHDVFRRMAAGIDTMLATFPSRLREYKDQLVDEGLARDVYRIMLMREPESEERVTGLARQGITLAQLVRSVADSDEFKLKTSSAA